MAKRPESVGIVALEMYFPPSYVRQDELEDFYGVSKGKYTIGLGQESLSFCTDVEDVVSISLTVVKSLLEKFSISPESIGRLEVGSETVIDKSKAIKTNLMQLFEVNHSVRLIRNGDIEGVDSTNACYGGTAALLNCLNWVESSGWDGRFALVVAADIAVYSEGPARPTGGAGAVAMLIGPNAPISMERSFTSSHMSHAYDFYKPDLPSEYPVVDGKLTQSCFLNAVDLCYRRFAAKFEKKEGKQFSLADADYCVFHSPYNKLVQKSLARLLYNDFLRSPSLVSDEASTKLQPYANISQEDSRVNRDLEKVSQQLAKAQYDSKVAPATLLPKKVGNMYCASVYAGLVSLVHNKSDDLAGKRIVLFSYGSGLASSILSFKVNQGQPPFSLTAVADALNIAGLLKATTAVPPEQFSKSMILGESRYGAKDFVPASSTDILRPGTYYLTKVDDKYRRSYARKPPVAAIATSNGVAANGNGAHL